jgi:flagellar hook-associated protein 2
MATIPSITAGGVGSGLDVNSIVSKLMTIAQQPLTLMQKKEDGFNAQLSAYGAIKGALSTLQTATTALTQVSAFSSKAASVSDPTALTAVASSAAAEGIYNITVSQLAAAQAVRSTAPYASITDTFTLGTLSISVANGPPVNVTIDSSNNTLAGISQAINQANAGVIAAVVNDGTTNRLLLTSQTSGLAGGNISLSVSNESGAGTNALSSLATLQETQPAQNAMFNVNGLAIERSSNTVTDALAGVTLKLTKGTLAAPASTVLTLSKDATVTTAAVNSFVKAYNDALAAIKTNSAFDITTKKATALTGDSSIRSVQSQLNGLLQTVVSGVAGGIGSLSDIGISRQRDGTLAVDSAKLNEVINDPAKDVASLFMQTMSGNEGIAVQFQAMLRATVGIGGMIDSRTSGISSSIKSIATSRDALNLRLTQLEIRYRAQFTALDTMMGSMQATSQYLTQQFAPRSSG